MHVNPLVFISHHYMQCLCGHAELLSGTELPENLMAGKATQLSGTSILVFGVLESVTGVCQT